jgi:hypothetical protein
MNSNVKTLYLAWQDKSRTRRWFPVGQLDAELHEPGYRFRYIQGALDAQRLAGFVPLAEFPDFRKNYRSPRLFQMFQNRVIMSGRVDFHEYLKQLDLPETAGPLEILSVDGGQRTTDNLEMFPKITLRDDGTFCCRFFLHGWSHVNLPAQERINSLKAGENLHVALELNNPVTTTALQIQTEDHNMIGWAPGYLAGDLMAAVAKTPSYKASVVRINPQPMPSRQRVLIELQGKWHGYAPMQSAEFDPLV